MNILTRKISIHAPPRGATVRAAIWEANMVISIHAPPRGATHKRVRRCGENVFQFTPLREGRRCGIFSTLQRNKFQFTPLREGRRR